MRRKNAASAFVMLIVCCSFLAKAAASTHQLMTGRGALASAHGVPVFDDARVASAALTAVQPTTLRADLVVELVRAGRRVAAIVVEVQLRPDAQKRLTWPVYVASTRLLQRS